jgi:hypothetical protein
MKPYGRMKDIIAAREEGKVPVKFSNQKRKEPGKDESSGEYGTCCTAIIRH